MLERAELNLNALLAIVVMLEEILTDCSLVQLLKQLEGIVWIELLDKSMPPERFTQALNVSPNSTDNDIGAKVSTPVPLQDWKGETPSDVRLEGKDATSLWQFWNA